MMNKKRMIKEERKNKYTNEKRRNKGGSFPGIES